MKHNTEHEVVLESLTTALLHIMEQKPFDEITVSELCQKAGVGRVSFYRNFKTKQDILVQYLAGSTDEWWAAFSQKEPEEFYSTFWSSLLAEYRKNEELLRLLDQNRLTYILRDHINACCGPRESDSDSEAYTRSMLAGMIYGLVREWIHRGMKDLPPDLNIRAMLETAAAVHITV